MGRQQVSSVFLEARIAEHEQGAGLALLLAMTSKEAYGGLGLIDAYL